VNDVHLIITEKNIAAERIARILADRAYVETRKDGGVNTYSFGDTTVIGLRGHVVEVDFEPGYSNWRSEQHRPRTLIDAKTIKTPTDKKIVTLVQKLTRRSDRVTIATDFDTEGELIGKETYDLVRAVRHEVPIDRARFSAITPQEIRAAFADPTEIDFALAAAGEARQVIDLIWGASLTRFISLAARRGGKNILSVGRVQSPTLAMIVDREREIEAFVPEPYWVLTVESVKDGVGFTARHVTTRFTDREAALLARSRTAPPLVVTDAREGQKVDRAPTPFDTTGFIVAAGRIGFSAANAMRIAEDLYMHGFISYPRTDNTIYPKSLDLNGILRTLEKTEFGDDISWVRAHRRDAPTRGKKSSTDHPPIHPAGAASRAELGEERWRLYELVVRRFLATLSPDARWATRKILFEAGAEPYTTTGSTLIEAGWRTVYPYSEAAERELPAFAVGERLPIEGVILEEKETQPPPRYTQSRLIQVMEELGLGTKSTRHEVIGKLVGRKYVEGNPLRPTLVGRAVIESLEEHADLITKPDMTTAIDAHMQEIKLRQRGRDEVVDESRSMLHRAFDELEAHGDEIGRDIMGRTVEEMILGPCPVCGADLRLHHIRTSQFIGCVEYPDCRFNIGLPVTTWGFAVRTDDICPEHGLNHVRLISKGARPWEIGCPLCHHIASNRETMALMPSITPELMERLNARHIYAVSEIASAEPDELAACIGVSVPDARRLKVEAVDVLALLRKRSELRKFVRAHVPPRRGRSHAKIMRALFASGIDTVGQLAAAAPETIRAVGIGEKETGALLAAAGTLCNDRRLREIGIPAISLKKYYAAGISKPEDFLNHPTAYLTLKTGISPDTVHRHVELVCEASGRPAPKRTTKVQLEKGRAELLSIPGVGESTIEKLYSGGVYDAESLATADPRILAEGTGLPVRKIQDFQARVGQSGPAVG
jgi:DNA topoisomerase-1